MSAVAPDEIERCLVEHGRKFLDTLAEKQVVIDGNHGALNEQRIDVFHYSKPLDSASRMDADQGRIETRDCRILNADAIEDKKVLARWLNLKTLIEVSSEVDYGDHTATAVRRYISDEDYSKAAYFNMLARGH